MAANCACVQVRLGKFDCVHLPETQACIHIEHPALDEPLDLILPEIRAEDYQDCWWDEIVERALDNWLAYYTLNIHRGRVVAFQALFDSNPGIRVDFQRACAAHRLCDCEARMAHLQREIAELRDVLSAECACSKRKGDTQAA